MPITRKLNIQAPVTKVTKPKAAPVPVSKKPAAVAVAEPKAKRVAVPRVIHAVQTLYSGESTGLNQRKSTTKLDVSSFNTKPDMVLTERTELVLQSLKDKYARNTFARGNIDAGVLKYAIWKGHIQPVSGDGGEDTVLRFTTAGMSYTAGQRVSKSKRAAA